MKILITGVTSFIGRALAKELISEGMSVWGIVRPDSKNKKDLPEQLNIIECDLGSCEKLIGVVPEDMDVCMHLGWDGIGRAGRMDLDIQKVNVDNTLKLIPVLKKLGCSRMIFAGSQAEYGIVKTRITEDTECNPVSEYGKAKLEVLGKAGMLCREYEISYIHARIFSVYGAGDHETSLVDSCVNAFMEDRNIDLGPCTQNWNYLYVGDCAKALADLATCVYTTDDDSQKGEAVVNIASEKTAVLREYVETIRKVIGKGSYTFNETPESPEGTPELDPDISKLKDITGFKETVTFEEGIKKIEEMYSLR